MSERAESSEPLTGVVVVDKPVGPTSFAVVRQARAATGARKVGHGGTLDPMASGVLPLCFGEATKLAQFLLDADKEYQATITFGVETDTYDAAGDVTDRRPTAHLHSEQVRTALEGFLGDQAQIPPMYSALKRDGKPLYAYARAGEILERAPRQVRIHVLVLEEFWRPPADDAGFGVVAPEAALPWARVLIRCSKGTYVRSLAFDLGRILGCGAHLTALRRIRSGPFGLEGAVAPETLAAGPAPMISLADALSHLATVVVTDEVAVLLEQGKPISWAKAGAAPISSGALVRILAPSLHLLAVARAATPEDLIRTLRVFRGWRPGFLATKPATKSQTAAG